MFGADWEDDTLPTNVDFYIRKSQAECSVDSIKTLLCLTNLFNECSTEREHYGTAAERNRIEVWTIRLEMRECETA